MGWVDRPSRSPPGNPGGSATEPGSDRQVVDPARIGQVLHRLCEARALVSARVPGQDETFLTTVLRVDPNARRFALDELSPRGGHEALLREQTLKVVSRVEGAEVRFSATLAASGAARGIAFYTLPFPHVLHYNQRRGSYRVPVGPCHQILLELQHPEAGALTGEVRDLSSGGLGVRVQLPDDLELPRGYRIPACTLVLLDGQRIPCNLEVRHVARLEGSRWTRLGILFVDLPPRERNLVAQLIVQLERERLRTRPAGSRAG